MDEENPAEVEHLAHRARVSPADKSTQSKSEYRERLCSHYHTVMVMRASHLCFRLRWTRGGSSDGALKMDLKIGTYFLKRTAETVKFRSSLSVLRRKSCDRPAMSCHFLILLKNSIRLKDRREKNSKRERERSCFGGTITFGWSDNDVDVLI